jgi:hypothetical protein
VPRSQLLWISCDEDRDQADAIVAEAARHGRALDPAWVVDLLSPDPRPETSFREPAVGVRSVSAFAIRMVDPRTPGETGDKGRLWPTQLRQLECLAGDNWLLTCWHKETTFVGAGLETVAPALAAWPPVPAALPAALDQQWIDEGGRNAADLGLLLLRAVTSTFPAFRKSLFAALNNWQADLSRDARRDRTEWLENSRGLLADMLGLLAVYYQRLASLNPPKSLSHRDSWFRGASSERVAEQVDDHIDAALRHTGVLADKVQASLTLLASHSSAVDAEQSQRLKRRLDLITSVLLIPALIASYFGANTALPGRGTWSGFALMVALTVLGGGAAYYFLTRTDPPSSKRS